MWGTQRRLERKTASDNGSVIIKKTNMEKEIEEQLRNLRNAVRYLANEVEKLAKDGRNDYAADHLCDEIDEKINHD
jgi:hypothetical protein